MNNPVWWTVTMVNDREKAMELGEAAVKCGLAACAQVEGPVTSIYSWKGDLHRDPEMRIVFKCSEANAQPLMSWIRAHHPYEVPEILAWPAALTNPDYQKWVEEG